MTDLYALSDSLLDALRPGCVRAEKAGSLRRGKADPKDIEIVAVQKFSVTECYDLFQNKIGEEKQGHLDTALFDIIEAGEWEFDPALRRNGAKYKRLRHRSARNHAGDLIACDLFIVTERSWGVQFTIRTGPGNPADNFSQALVTRAHDLGMFVDGGLLHKHHRLYKFHGNTSDPLPCEKGDHCPLIIPTLEEADFLRALKIEWLEPATRSVKNIRTIKL